VRNVTACPFAGVSPDEPFDITPYTLALHDYFLFNPLNLTLPRKFKIAVESCPLDCAQATINDIGLYAKREGGKDGFSVWAGGGLGASPFLAVKVADFVPADDVLIVCEAIVRIQHRSGERKNRHKARLKFLVKKMGTAAFAAAVREETARVERERGDELRADVRESVAAYRVAPPAPAQPPVAPLPGFDAWARTNALAQRAAEYCAVTVTLPLGDIDTDQLRALARLAERLGNGTARVTNEQNVVLPWVRRDSLPRLHAALVELGLAEGGASTITDVVSCPGLDYCSLAVTRSMGVGQGVRDHLAEQVGDPLEFGPFHVKISGCPNSCGQHHIGDVGMTGMMVKDEHGVEHPHYSLLLGGAVGEGRTRIGKRLVGRFAEADAPRAIAALAGHYRANRQSDERFGEFVDRVGVDALDAVARQAALAEVK
jgi:sulfite reductase beta subunit-like hemoprotein